MVYAYIRVSSITQNIDRQLDEIMNLGLDKKSIFIDKQSGKDFNRTSYSRLRRKLKKHDLLIVKSIDRLGRNYQMIIEEWRYITKVIGADIKVIDTPLLDTTIEDTGLVKTFISDMFLQVLSFVAENERELIRARQAEGIRVAKNKGVKFGRPAAVLPDNFNEVAGMYLRNEINSYEAIILTKMKRGTFFKYLKSYKY